MKKIVSIIICLLTIGGIVIINSCKKKIEGCTDPTAINYNYNATDDNGSCIAKSKDVLGCMDVYSLNYNSSATIDDGSCQYNGNVTFWYNSNGTNATVTIGGKTGYITSYYSTYNPSCGSSGCANFTLQTGSYSFYASSTYSTWNGTITVTKNGCTLMLLE